MTIAAPRNTFSYILVYRDTTSTTGIQQRPECEVLLLSQDHRAHGFKISRSSFTLVVAAKPSFGQDVTVHRAQQFLLGCAGLQQQSGIQGIKLEIVAVRFAGRRTWAAITDAFEIVNSQVRALRFAYMSIGFSAGGAMLVLLGRDISYRRSSGA